MKKLRILIPTLLATTAMPLVSLSTCKKPEDGQFTITWKANLAGAVSKIEPETIKVNENAIFENIQKPAFTINSGFARADDNWYFDEACQNVISNETIISKDMTIYAKFKADVHPTSVTIDQGSEISCYMSDSTFLTCTVLPEEATIKDVIWSIDNEDIASIDPKTGLLKAFCEGTANVTATTVDGGLTATCKLDINDIPLYFEKDGTTKDQDPTIMININNAPSDNFDLEYKIDNGDWKPWEITDTKTSKITIDDGQRIYVRNNKQTFSEDSMQSSDHARFVMEDNKSKIKAGGNVNSLINNGELSNWCFGDLFNNCKTLTHAPQLPATNLYEGCYFSMFYGCLELIEMPKLNATTLPDSCYWCMFDKCYALTTIETIKAPISIEFRAMNNMFANCQKLSVTEDSRENLLIDFKSIKSFPEAAISKMFYLTAGPYTGDPQPGKAYYWVEQ